MSNAFPVPNIPANEAARLDALRRYHILDTPPEGAFNRVATIARTLFNTPVAIVSLVDADRIWFKANEGLPSVAELDRSTGLCSLAILNDEPTVIENALDDPCLLANPLVAGDFGLRFYAGAPLRTHDGFHIGTICVVDQEPRSCSVAQLSMLQQLAGIVMDEIELRLAARQAVRNQSQLLGIAVHDLKNPLQGVLGFASLIEAAPDDPEVSEAAAQISQAARRMVKIVDDAVSNAIHQQDEITLQLSPVVLSTLVEQVVQTNAVLATQKGQTITCTIAGQPQVQGDANRLFEMIDNLIGNAIKYSPADAPISVVVGIRDNEVWIMVQDTGPGLSEQDQAHLFGRFARLSARPTGNERSTGLGLWITKRLTELHRGRIWAESAGSGCGSCFVIALPLLVPPDQASPEQTTKLNTDWRISATTRNPLLRPAS